MVKTSRDFEQEFIDTAAEKTGYTVEQWMPIVKSSGLLNQEVISKWLKKNYRLNHMQASLLSGIYLNYGKPVYNKTDLLESQFINCTFMRTLYKQVTDKILICIKDAQYVPKKTYVSCLVIKEFAAIKIQPDAIHVGMILEKKSSGSLFPKANIPGSSSKISHMVIINDFEQFDETIIKYLQWSYYNTHSNFILNDK